MMYCASMATRVGVISDTHGLLRPEALRALEGVQLIVHAGDVGRAGILADLGRIAPVTAVRGNVDYGPWADALPLTEVVGVESSCLYVLHDLGELDLDPTAAGFHAVISGHSHVPLAETRSGVLFLNPGSAGPRRFKLPISLAILTVDGERLTHRFVELAAGPANKSSTAHRASDG
jgi:putative phosphoesterase